MKPEEDEEQVQDIVVDIEPESVTFEGFKSCFCLFNSLVAEPAAEQPIDFDQFVKDEDRRELVKYVLYKKNRFFLMC